LLLKFPSFICLYC